jgi:transcriptional regulator NrdR family protein
MSVKADQIAERVSQVISEREDRENIEAQIQELENHMLSNQIEKEFQIRFGSNWRNYSDLVKVVEEQRRLEDNAISEFKKLLENEEGKE